ncbi:hypothetical protein NDU88_004733 [Pleurodeles waltl]|uniref:Uncharacterized protein n=1 Tax=Pleurodeles waltl TaxID=8319 RepID=A0AAV7RLC1_PLEWA|nr:hypothetical protein NDU88_004733 [Pleurodeles waltl]
MFDFVRPCTKKESMLKKVRIFFKLIKERHSHKGYKQFSRTISSNNTSPAFVRKGDFPQQRTATLMLAAHESSLPRQDRHVIVPMMPCRLTCQLHHIISE